MTDSPLDSPRRITRVWQWSRRQPWVVASLLGLLSIIGVLIVLELRESRRAQALRSEKASIEKTLKSVQQERDDARTRLYDLDILELSQIWESARIARIRDKLIRYQTGTHEAALRGFEWYYWRNRARLAGFLEAGLPPGMEDTPEELPTDQTLTIGEPDRPGSITDLTYVRRGIRLATSSADGTVRLWDPGSGALVATFTTPEHHPVAAVAASLDGRFLAGSLLANQVAIWDTWTGQIHARFDAPTGPFTHLAFSPDNRTLALASARLGTVLRWDVLEKRPLAEFRGGIQPFSGIAFSPDGTRLVAGQDVTASGTPGSIFQWDTDQGNLINQLRGHRGPIRGLAYRADGKVLASGSDDSTVRVWNVGDATAIQVLRGHASGVRSVAFSPDGRRLASGSSDTLGSELKVWDVATGLETLELPGHARAVVAVGFRPDGGQLASAGDEGTIKLWSASPLTPGQKSLMIATNLVQSLFESRRPLEEILDQIRQDSTLSLDVSHQALNLARGRAEAILNEEAARLVASRFQGLTIKEEVVAGLETDPSLSEPIRAKALALAERVRSDANFLNNTSWAVVSLPGSDETTYRQALHLAEVACRVQPDNMYFLNTLGVAQYRVGRYHDALESLTRTDAFNSRLPTGSEPSDLAFLALSRHQLGQTGPALALLEQLRTVVNRRRFALEPEARRHWQEAEVIEWDRKFPPDPFQN